jgi:hypothetical protein
MRIGAVLLSRVTMDIRQTRLHKLEYEEFHFEGKSSEVLGDFQVNR